MHIQVRKIKSTKAYVSHLCGQLPESVNSPVHQTLGETIEDNFGKCKAVDRHIVSCNLKHICNPSPSKTVCQGSLYNTVDTYIQVLLAYFGLLKASQTGNIACHHSHEVLKNNIRLVTHTGHKYRYVE